jgi:hypothetical protein
LKKINEIQSSFIDETENKFISDKHNLAVIENLIKSYKNKNITIELHDQFELLFEMINNWPIGNFLYKFNTRFYAQIFLKYS